MPVSSTDTTSVKHTYKPMSARQVGAAVTALTGERSQMTGERRNERSEETRSSQMRHESREQAPRWQEEQPREAKD